MTDFRSHKVRVSNIPQGDSLCNIGTKSIGVILFSWLCVVVMLLTEYKVIAIPFLFVALLLTFRSGKKQFKGTNKFFVIFNSADPDNCDLVYLSEVQSWEYRVKKDGNDYMSIILQENEKFRITEGVNFQMYKYFQRQLPQLEVRNKKDKGS